jgi:hypothetical protein
MDFTKEFTLLAKNMDLKWELRRVEDAVPSTMQRVPSPKGDLVSVAFRSRHSRAGLLIFPSLPGLACGKPGTFSGWDGKECGTRPAGDHPELPGRGFQ